MDHELMDKKDLNIKPNSKESNEIDALFSAKFDNKNRQKQKVLLFNKLRDKGIFWSYSKDISYDKAGDDLFIEYLLKYGDFEDISLGFKLFGKRVMKRVWEERLKSDKRFIRLNLLIARVFLGMDVESSYFKKVKNARLEKLKLLTS
jgi:hypothetical protein